MNEINLSYVLTTFNKLEYLKVALPYLIAACQADEEIVVVDGGSTDGTTEYLTALKNQNKIHQYASAPDFGEAHGTNKAMLMAKGKLLKVITDDDVYSYRIINEGKQFMLRNEHIDVFGFDGFSYHFGKDKVEFQKSRFIEGFKQWKISKKPFIFCGLSFLIRRSSLAYLGLFNPTFKIIDLEYSFRVSTLKSKIAFHTGMGFVAIANPDSNSVKFISILETERKRVNRMHYIKTNNFNPSGLKSWLYPPLIRLKNKLMPPAPAQSSFDFEAVYLEGVEILRQSDIGEILASE